MTMLNIDPIHAQAIWYYGSDVAMFFAFLFIWYSREMFTASRSVSSSCTHSAQQNLTATLSTFWSSGRTNQDDPTVNLLMSMWNL